MSKKSEEFSLKINNEIIKIKGKPEKSKDEIIPMEFVTFNFSRNGIKYKASGLMEIEK